MTWEGTTPLRPYTPTYDKRGTVIENLSKVVWRNVNAIFLNSFAAKSLVRVCPKEYGLANDGEDDDEEKREVLWLAGKSEKDMYGSLDHDGLRTFL